MQIVLYDIGMEKFNYTADGEYSKRGYLLNNFKVFNINDKSNEKFEFHYHEFNKIIFFKSGDVKYNIEGKEYLLSPYDILLVKRGDIHRPIINENENYDRIVIWIDDYYLNSVHLAKCFEIADEKHFNVIKSADLQLFKLAEKLTEGKIDDFASAQYNEAILIQLLILIARREMHSNIDVDKYKSNKQIDDVIHYINNNLDKKLRIDLLAEKFFISRYHLMHKFKEVTGRTIYSYIQSKRLLKATNYINNGMSAKQACLESGFKDYSVFLKTFKKEFGTTPVKYRQNKDRD